MKYVINFVINDRKILYLTNGGGTANEYTLPSFVVDDQISSDNIRNLINENFGYQTVGNRVFYEDDSTILVESLLLQNIDIMSRENMIWIPINNIFIPKNLDKEKTIIEDYFREKLEDNVKLLFGLKNGKIRFISEISESERGLACGCTCPACGQNLQARIGHGKRQPHFAHHGSYCDTRVAQQTALHMLAKEILNESMHLVLPAYEIFGSYSDYDIDELDYEAIEALMEKLTFRPAVDFYFDNVVLEKKIDDIIPDVVVWKNGTSRKLLIEIAVTHFIDETKKQIICSRKLPTLEIDLSQLTKQAYRRETIREIIVEKSDLKNWIYNSYLEAASTELEARNQKIIEDAQERTRAQDLNREQDKIYRMKKYTEYEVKRMLVHEKLENLLTTENYKNKVQELRNDSLVFEFVRNLSIFPLVLDELPYFLDLPVTGEIVFLCDRRIWQMKLFDLFIFNRKPDSTISLNKIWSWISKHSEEVYINWDLVTRIDMKLGTKIYNKNLAIEAIKQYLLYLGKLGFIDNNSELNYYEKYRVMHKTLVPPISISSIIMQNILASFYEVTPEIDSIIQSEFAYLEKKGRYLRLLDQQTK